MRFSPTDLARRSSVAGLARGTRRLRWRRSAPGSLGRRVDWSSAADGRCPSIASLEAYVPRQTSKVYARRRPLHHRAGPRAAHAGPPRSDPASTCATPSSPPKTSASTSTTASTTTASSARSRATCAPGGYAQGFSTITMQLARNVFPDRHLAREDPRCASSRRRASRAPSSSAYSKDKILELYLNQIYLGNGAYGVETAAQRYFGKSMRESQPGRGGDAGRAAQGARSATIRAASPTAPCSVATPCSSSCARERVITAHDASLAKAYPLQLAQRTESGDVAPYFVEWVRAAARRALRRPAVRRGPQGLHHARRRHAGRRRARAGKPAQGHRGGTARARTSTSPTRRTRRAPPRAARPARPTRRTCRARSSRSIRAPARCARWSAAATSTTPSSIAPRRRCGSRGRRSSRSCTPTAIHDGLQPRRRWSTTRPSRWTQMTGEAWTPQNYDMKFMGQMPLRKALVHVAQPGGHPHRPGTSVREAVIAMARRFGITTPIPPYPSIFIGSADVYPLEMIGAYSVFANLGMRTTPHAIVQGRERAGQGGVAAAVRARSGAVARGIVADGEHDEGRRRARHGSRACGATASTCPAGGKTGTTNDGSDVWFIGYTADLVAGVWMGFDRPHQDQGERAGR